MSVYMLFFYRHYPHWQSFLLAVIASLFGASMALLAGAVVSVLAVIIGWFMRYKAEAPSTTINAIEVEVTTVGSHD